MGGSATWPAMEWRWRTIVLEAGFQMKKVLEVAVMYIFEACFQNKTFLGTGVRYFLDADF